MRSAALDETLHRPTSSRYSSAMSNQGALIIIDVQQGFDDPIWGLRNNADCDKNILRLLAAWRFASQPVVLVRHDSVSPTSPLRPGQPGNSFKAGVDGTHDLLVTKSVNSAFYGSPDLDAWLRANSISKITICGITTNHCCETTARMAGNLGYDTRFVIDATHTFDRIDLSGKLVSADELMRITATNLESEFATVVTTAQVLSSL